MISVRLMDVRHELQDRGNVWVGLGVLTCLSFGICLWSVCVVDVEIWEFKHLLALIVVSVGDRLNTHIMSNRSWSLEICLPFCNRDNVVLLVSS